LSATALHHRNPPIGPIAFLAGLPDELGLVLQLVRFRFHGVLPS
jgi:hypothetical protein